MILSRSCPLPAVALARVDFLARPSISLNPPVPYGTGASPGAVTYLMAHRRLTSASAEPNRELGICTISPDLICYFGLGSVPATLGRPPLERKHAAHQRLPGNRTNDSVYHYGRNVERKGLLETTHRRVCRWSKDPVDLGPIAGIARQVAKLELLLHPSNRVALASLFDLYYKSRPRYGIDNPVGRQPMARLKRFHRGSGVRTEYAVDDDAMPARLQQILQRLYRVRWRRS
jgi:hypothetical protein